MRKTRHHNNGLELLLKKRYRLSIFKTINAMVAKKSRKAPVGRPAKFAEASLPVTVTLPLRTLASLQRIDQDRAKAIVKCTEAVTGAGLADKWHVEIIKVLDDCGLIVIGPCASLHKLPDLRLIEIAPLRFLLVILDNYSPHALELDIMDLIEGLAPEEEEERALLEELRLELSRHRRQDSMTSASILLVDI